MEFEKRPSHDDGPHTSLVVKFPLLNAQGRCHALCGIATDITDRNRRTKSVQRLAKDRLLLSSPPEKGFMVSTGRPLHVHQYSGGAHARVPLDEMIGKDMHEMIHHSFPGRFAYSHERCHIYETLTSGKGCQIDDEVFWRNDGSSFPVAVSVLFLYWNKNKLSERSWCFSTLPSASRQKPS